MCVFILCILIKIRGGITDLCSLITMWDWWGVILIMWYTKMWKWKTKDSWMNSRKKSARKVNIVNIFVNWSYWERNVSLLSGKKGCCYENENCWSEYKHSNGKAASRRFCWEILARIRSRERYRYDSIHICIWTNMNILCEMKILVKCLLYYLLETSFYVKIKYVLEIFYCYAPSWNNFLCFSFMCKNDKGR